METSVHGQTKAVDSSDPARHMAEVGSLFGASPRGATWVVSAMPGGDSRVVQAAEGPPGVSKVTGGKEQSPASHEV